MDNGPTLGDILTAAMKGNDDMLNVSMNKEEAMIYAKALAAAGRKIEAIKIVREMYWLPLEKFNGYMKGYNSLRAAKEFVEGGFVLPYEPKVGDKLRYDATGGIFLIRAIHGNEFWLYNCEDKIHGTWELSDFRALFKHVED